jgi:hypothetical protein
MGSLCGTGSRHGPASPKLIPADSDRSSNRAQTISPLIPAIGQSMWAQFAVCGTRCGVRISTNAPTRLLIHTGRFGHALTS